GEVLVLGAIYPDEILRVKIDNTSRHSELIEIDPASGALVLLERPDMKSNNKDVKDKNNWRTVVRL
ncbi:MAG: hypothetical protein ACMG6E_02070, partial [Candidatus Roizmanbacteria bacterium]